jgi:hypothetical protein
MKKKFYSLMISLFFAEMGLFLVIFPWIDMWEKNYFVHLSSGLTAFLLNYFFRGAISGLGILDLWFSLSEILSIGKSVTGNEK